MFEGIAAGFIFSLTLIPGTVWLAKVGFIGTKRHVSAVSLGFWTSHLLWLSLSVPALMVITRNLSFAKFAIHAFATFVLLYMGIKYFRSAAIQRIDDAPPLDPPIQLFWAALRQSFSMPMRLPAVMAILISLGVFVRNEPSWSTVVSAMAGATLGLVWWWGKFAVLGAYFAKRVSPPVTVRSLNKLRYFCGMLCFALAMTSILHGL